MRLVLFVLLIVVCSCARTVPERIPHGSQVAVKVQDSLSLKNYVTIFENHIDRGAEIDLVIEVTRSGAVSIPQLFESITSKVKHNRFIGVIQPACLVQPSPEVKPMRCDVIKFHVHVNNRHGIEISSNNDGMSTLQIIFLHDPDLIII